MLTNARSPAIIHSYRTNVSNRFSRDRTGDVIGRDIMTAERTRYMYSKVYMEPDRYYKPERRTSRKRISRAERIARRRRERMKKMAAFFLTLIIMTAIGLFIGIKLTTTSANADTKAPRQKYYREYQIEKGDTLWSIAEDEMGPGWSDIREYVYEVEVLNGIEGDNLTAGNYLQLPYYE